MTDRVRDPARWQVHIAYLPSERYTAGWPGLRESGLQQLRVAEPPYVVHSWPAGVAA